MGETTKTVYNATMTNGEEKKQYEGQEEMKNQ